MLKPEDINMVISHGSCPDGFGAAWAAWTIHKNNIEYYFASYNGKIDEENLPNVEGKNVLMVDFAYPIPRIMNNLNDQANGMLLLDHHKTTQEALEGKIDCDHIFDMNRSGARMAWDYFHPNKPVSKLIRHIEDRDIWKWELPHSRTYLSALDSYPQEFEVYEWVNGLTGNDLETFLNEGKAIMRYHQLMVDKAVSKGVYGELLAPDGSFYPCYAVNSASKELISDVGNELAKKGAIGLVWGYSHEHELTFISLRSRGHFDVSLIAKKFGGGGHAPAAGFEYKGNINDIFIPQLREIKDK